MARSSFRLAKKDIALVAATAKDLLQYNVPSGQKALLKAWAVDFDGVNASANHVLVQLIRQSTPNPTGGTDVTADAVPKHRGNPTTPRGVFKQAASGGTDHATQPFYDQRRIHPTSGYVDVLALGEEYELEPGEAVVIRCTAPANVNASSTLLIEE